MSDMIMGKRYMERENFDSGPGWHHITPPVQGDFTAREVYEDRFGKIEIEEARLICPDFPDLIIPERVLVRHPVPEDPTYRSFGIAGPDYRLVSPAQIVRIWDECITLPVETMASLYEGRCMFITCRLPDFSIMGDQMQNYMALNAWFSTLDGGANKVIVSPVREVCANTLRLAESMAVETYKIVHDVYAVDRMRTWLTNIVDRALGKMATIEDALTLLAKTAVTEEAKVDVLTAAYPLPNAPQRNAPDDVMEGRWKRYEVMTQSMVDRRLTALDMFEGLGTGMHTKAAFGTLWGLYNAVVEVEDYRRGGSDVQAATSAILGNRAAAKERAFESALAIARN